MRRARGASASRCDPAARPGPPSPGRPGTPARVGRPGGGGWRDRCSRYPAMAASTAVTAQRSAPAAAGCAASISAGRRTALHRDAGQHHDQVKPRCGPARPGPVHEDDPVTGQQDVVRPDVAVRQGAARPRRAPSRPPGRPGRSGARGSSGPARPRARPRPPRRRCLPRSRPGRPASGSRGRTGRAPPLRVGASTGAGVRMRARSAIAASTRSSSAARHGWAGMAPSTSSNSSATQPPESTQPR